MCGLVKTSREVGCRCAGNCGTCPFNPNLYLAFLRDDLIARDRGAEAVSEISSSRTSSQPAPSCAKLAILMEAGSEAVGCIPVTEKGVGRGQPGHPSHPQVRSGPVAPVFAVRVSAVTLHWLPACFGAAHRDPPCLAEPAGGN